MSDLMVGDFNISAVVRKYSGVAFILISIGFGYAQLRSTTEAIKEISVRMDQIDQRGTTGSRIAITQQEVMMESNTRRIDELEKSMKELEEKYATILAKLDSLAVLLEKTKH